MAEPFSARQARLAENVISILTVGTTLDGSLVSRSCIRTAVSYGTVLDLVLARASPIVWSVARFCLEMRLSLPGTGSQGAADSLALGIDLPWGLPLVGLGLG